MWVWGDFCVGKDKVFGWWVWGFCGRGEVYGCLCLGRVVMKGIGELVVLVVVVVGMVKKV